MNAWWDWMLISSLLITWILPSCCVKMVVNFDFNLSETYSATTITGAKLDKYVDQSDFITEKKNTIRES